MDVLESLRLFLEQERWFPSQQGHTSYRQIKAVNDYQYTELNPDIINQSTIMIISLVSCMVISPLSVEYPPMSGVRNDNIHH